VAPPPLVGHGHRQRLTQPPDKLRVVRVRPITPQAAADEVAQRIAGLPSPGPAVRVLVDGAPAAEPGRWADALVEPLRLRGRPVLRASAADFLRPASLRLEYGRRNPHSLLDGWFDFAAMRRELLDPLGEGGSGRVLLRWWDEASDRSARADYVSAPAAAVLVVDGSLLLGAGLPAELTVHLHVTDGALRRRTPAADEWTLPAYAEYAEQVRPHETADVTLLVDHPARPALAD
jgi:hypothetical protein